MPTPRKKRSSKRANVVPIAATKKTARPSGHAKGIEVRQEQEVTLKKTTPPQLELFQSFLPDDLHVDDYSNTIELYDAVPKYFSSKQRMEKMRIDGTFLHSLEFPFRHRDTDYTVTITPARIKEKDGSYKEYYPSFREELVEQALMKIACHYLNGVFLDNETGVQFTLYELRKELQRRNHGMTWHDLIKSLKICRGADIEIAWQEHGKPRSIHTSIFSALLLADRHEWKTDPKNTRCYVQFNLLVTRCLQELTYRQFNYTKFMGLKLQLSRWFLKRLSHNYVQAGWTTPYRITLTRIVQDSALVNNQEIRHRIRAVDRALDELKEEREGELSVLSGYEKEVRRGARNRIIEVHYTLIPDPDFTSQVKKANRRKTYLVQKSQQDPKSL